MSDNPVHFCFLSNEVVYYSSRSKFWYKEIKIIVIPVSVKEMSSSLHMFGCFTSNKTFLASVATILDSWKFVLSVTLRHQTH